MCGCVGGMCVCGGVAEGTLHYYIEVYVQCVGGWGCVMCVMCVCGGGGCIGGGRGNTILLY